MRHICQFDGPFLPSLECELQKEMSLYFLNWCHCFLTLSGLKSSQQKCFVSGNRYFDKFVDTTRFFSLLYNANYRKVDPFSFNRKAVFSLAGFR